MKTRIRIRESRLRAEKTVANPLMSDADGNTDGSDENDPKEPFSGGEDYLQLRSRFVRRFKREERITINDVTERMEVNGRVATALLRRLETDGFVSLVDRREPEWEVE